MLEKLTGRSVLCCKTDVNTSAAPAASMDSKRDPAWEKANQFSVTKKLIKESQVIISGFQPVFSSLGFVGFFFFFCKEQSPPECKRLKMIHHQSSMGEAEPGALSAPWEPGARRNGRDRPSRMLAFTDNLARKGVGML